MSNQVYASALKSTLQEIQNVCPDVSRNFIFKDGEILAKDKNTDEETVTQTIDAFKKITEGADIIGGLEAITIQGVEGKVNIAAIKDFHLTTVSSKEADEKYINTLTRVLIPIVTKLVDEIKPTSIETETITTDDKTITQVEPEPVEEVTEEIIDEPEAKEAEEFEELDEGAAMRELYGDAEQVELPADNEPLLPEPPVTQLIVENLGGFLVPSDTVRVDEDVIAQWNELYGEKKIGEVEIGALNGKKTRCKVKEIKKSRDSGKGIIKMPEKIQLTLEIASGELVTVKPVVE
jgi:hypothetical protein